MPEGPSTLSQLAAGLYMLVFLASSFAAANALGRRQAPWHSRRWIALAALFAVLAILRMFDIEEQLRDGLRAMLRSQESYQMRREYQAPVAAAIFAVSGAAALLWFHRIASRIGGRRNFAVVAGSVGGLGMALLIAVRLLSLHAVDRLLYGALKLNWIADIGLSCLVAGAAIQYVRLLRAHR